MNIPRIHEELRILRHFIDFVNKQVGMYCDCLSGFEGNSARVERQISRILVRSANPDADSQRVMVWTSIEEPNSQEVIHHRIIRAQEFLQDNSEAGFHERQLCQTIIVFLFSYWDEEIRPKLATARKVSPSDIRVDALGDLRLLRNNVIHNAGVLASQDHQKMKAMSCLFRPNTVIAPSHDEMHKVFISIKNAIARIIIEQTNHLPGAPDPDDIVDVAIQNT